MRILCNPDTSPASAPRSSRLRPVAGVAALALLGAAAACSDDANPAAPSALSSPASPSPGGPLARTPSSPPPAGRAELHSVHGGAGGAVDTIAPGSDRYGPNAYDFFAHMDSGMLRLALVEDAMAGMRQASQPHRLRQIEVFHCTSEPHHVLQTCGPALYSGTMQLAGRLELPPIELAGCASHEWLVVTASELIDDRYSGWRNAPCPQPNGVAVGSDGTGPGWDRGQHGPPERNFPPEPEPAPAPTPDPPAAPAPTPDAPAPTPDPPAPAPTPDPPAPAPTPDPPAPAPTPDPPAPAPTPDPPAPAPTPDPPAPAPTPDPPAPAPPPPSDSPRPGRVFLASGLFTTSGTTRSFPDFSITADTPSWANTESTRHVTVAASGTMNPAIAPANARWIVEVLSEDETVLASAVCRLIGRATLRITWTNDGAQQTDELPLSSSTDSGTGPAGDEPGFALYVPWSRSTMWTVDSGDVFRPHSARISIELD